MWQELAMACEYLKEHTSTYLLELRKTMKNLMYDILVSGLRSKPSHPVYMAGVLTTQPQYSGITHNLHYNLSPLPQLSPANICY
jgi:hypothetical protein